MRRHSIQNDKTYMAGKAGNLESCVRASTNGHCGKKCDELQKGSKNGQFSRIPDI